MDQLRQANLDTYGQYLNQPSSTQPSMPDINLQLNHQPQRAAADELGDAFSNLDKLLAAGRPKQEAQGPFSTYQNAALDKDNQHSLLPNYSDLLGQIEKKPEPQPQQL